MKNKAVLFIAQIGGRGAGHRHIGVPACVIVAENDLRLLRLRVKRDVFIDGVGGALVIERLAALPAEEGRAGRRGEQIGKHRKRDFRPLGHNGTMDAAGVGIHDFGDGARIDDRHVQRKACIRLTGIGCELHRQGAGLGVHLLHGKAAAVVILPERLGRIAVIDIEVIVIVLRVAAAADLQPIAIGRRDQQPAVAVIGIGSVFTADVVDLARITVRLVRKIERVRAGGVHINVIMILVVRFRRQDARKGRHLRAGQQQRQRQQQRRQLLPRVVSHVAPP